MTPKRNRTLNAGAGLLTALTLGVASLAGCAPFDPNPAATGGQQTPGGTTPSAAPGNPGTNPGTPSTNPGTPATTAPAAGLQVKATAMVAGKPLANADFKAIDLVTGKTLPLVSAGGMNLKTDAQGNFDTKVAIAEGQVVKLVVQGAEKGQTVSTIIAGGKAGALNGIGMANGSFKITEGSTVASNVMGGMFQLAGSAAPAKAAMRALMQIDLADALSILESFFREANSIAEGTDALPADLRAELAANVDNSGAIPNNVLGRILGQSEAFKNTVQTAAGNALQAYAAAGVNAEVLGLSNLAADLAILETLNFKVTLTATKLEIAGNGVTVTATEDDTPPTEGEQTPPPDVDVVIDEPNEEDPEDEDEEADAFSPEFTLKGSATTTNSLELTVSQDEGEEDLDLIVVKMNKDALGATFLPSDTDGNAVIASGNGIGDTFATANGVFSIKDTNAPDIAFEDVRDGWVPQPGSDDELEVAWKGTWVSANKTIANVNVWQNDDFLFLVIKRVIGAPTNSSITVKGHSTTINVPKTTLKFTQATFDTQYLTNDAQLEIFMKSRTDDGATGSTAFFYRKLQKIDSAS